MLGRRGEGEPPRSATQKISEEASSGPCENSDASRARPVSLLMIFCTADQAELFVSQVVPQPGDFYGGWMTSDIEGPVKGGPGTWGW